jgi:hypothetical protein
MHPGQGVALDLLATEQPPTCVLQVKLADKVNLSSLINLIGFYDGNPTHGRTLSVNKYTRILHGRKSSKGRIQLALLFCERFEGKRSPEIVPAKLERIPIVPLN